MLNYSIFKGLKSMKHKRFWFVIFVLLEIMCSELNLSSKFVEYPIYIIAVMYGIKKAVEEN